MMRGRQNVAVAVRCPDGKIEVTELPLASMYKGRFRERPLIRGIIVLIETMVLGMQALFYSAQVASEEDGEEISSAMLWATAAFAVVFAVAIFFVLPLLVTHFFIDPHITSAWMSNLLEGILRIGIFILYLWLINLMPDIRAVFAYHGAEHKSINAYEAGASLEVEQVKKYSTAHTRCGTNFLLVVLVLAIIIFTFFGQPVLWLRIMSRIVLIPVIAAIGYEFIRFGAAHMDNRIVRGIVAPGLILQKMTTREPDDSQVETALSALKKVLEADHNEQTNFGEPQTMSSAVNS